MIINEIITNLFKHSRICWKGEPRGKFSTGMLLGTVFGIGILMLDKKNVKKAKKMMNGMHF